MTNSALILVGAFLAAELIIIFRGFFVLSQYPLFHLPIIFFIFGIEVLAGFFFYKKINSIINRGRFFIPAIGLSSVYIPFFTILMSQEKIILGLSFSSQLPWYALTVYPVLIFLPLALAFTIFFKELVTKKINPEFLFLGFTLYFLTDLIVLWRFELIYSALTASTLGFMIFCITAYKTLPKVKCGIILAALCLLIFSSYPRKFIHCLKSFTREFKTTVVLNNITPYGEFYIHKKKDNYVFSINHSKVFRYPDTQNIQEIVHLSLLQYPWVESILVIGEWIEIIEEVLKYQNIKNVYWANPVPDCFKIGSEILPGNFTCPEKLRILRSSDPGNFIKKIGKEKIFDVVIISLPDPTNIFFNRYYTHEFFKGINSVLTDNSMLSITVKTGEDNLSGNHKLLSATVYNTLLRTFPNTLELYGRKSLILASHNRNFTTSHLALAEFLNTLKTIPDYISSSLIKYKLNSRESVKKKLDIDYAPINLDTKPASLKYAFHELLFTFGVLSRFIIKLTDSINSIVIYIILTVISLIFIKLLSKKPIEDKLKVIMAVISFAAGIFIYDMIVSLHSNSGQIFRFMPLILMGTVLGILLSIMLLKKRHPKNFVSYLRIFLMFSGLFLILLPAVFEMMLSPPPPFCTFLFSLIGGFIFGSIKYLGINSYLKLKNGMNEILKLYTFILCGFLIACIGALIMVPVMGIIDVLPAIGIFSLGCVTLISI